MKIINIKNKKFIDRMKFWKDWDLLDGQKRGEVIFRRMYVVGSVMGILMLGTTLLSPKYKETQKDVQLETPIVKETVLKTGDILNGSRIVIDENGKVWYQFIQDSVSSGTLKDKKKVSNKKETPKQSSVKGVDVKRIVKVYEKYGSPRAKDVEWIYTEATKRKINPSLFLAVQGIESSYGKNCIQNNCWGFGKWGDGTVVSKYFTGKNYREGTLIVMNGWVENGYTVNTAEQMQSKGYNSSSHWLNNVKLIQSYWE